MPPRLPFINSSMTGSRYYGHANHSYLCTISDKLHIKRENEPQGDRSRSCRAANHCSRTCAARTISCGDSSAEDPAAAPQIAPGNGPAAPAARERQRLHVEPARVSGQSSALRINSRTLNPPCKLIVLSRMICDFAALRSALQQHSALIRMKLPAGAGDPSAITSASATSCAWWMPCPGRSGGKNELRGLSADGGSGRSAFAHAIVLCSTRSSRAARLRARRPV